MRPDRRRLWLGGLLAVSAALVAWDRLAGGGAATVEAVRRPDAAAAPSAAPAAVAVASTPAGGTHAPASIARLAPRTVYLDALAAEAEDAAATVAAAPPPAPVASVPAAPAPPPPPPFRVIGKGRIAGGWEVYLAQANRVVIAHAGDHLDGQYEVVAITPPALQLLYLPTHEASSLPIGAAFDD